MGRARGPVVAADVSSDHPSSENAAAGLVLWSRTCLPRVMACKFRAALDSPFLCWWSRSNSLTSSASCQLKVGSGGLDTIPAGRIPGFAPPRGAAGVKAGTGVVRSCFGFT